MLTPSFEADNKLFAAYPSDSGDPLVNVMEIFRKDAALAAQLLAHRTYPTPDMRVYVEPGRNIHVNGVNINFAGGYTAAFVQPSVGTRIDLLAINALGQLVVFPNTSGNANYPANVFPIAEIRITSTATSITDADITDVRQIFGPRTTIPARAETVQLGSQAANYPTNTIFNVGATYVVGTLAIDVFIDGTRVVRGRDFTELNTTQIQLNYPVEDTVIITIVRNDSAGYDIGSKVNRSGDIMTGNLRVPQLEIGTTNDRRISVAGNNMMFRDLVQTTARSLDDLYKSHLGYHYAVATSGQTVFPLPFNYEVGSNKLMVFVEGVLKAITVDYTETGAAQVTFTSGVTLGDKVIFRNIV